MKEKIYILIVILFSGFVFLFALGRSCGCADPVRSRDAARRAHLNQLKRWLTDYLLLNNYVPVYKDFTGTDILSGYLMPDFLKKMPQDPLVKQKYYYKSVGGTWFVLAAEMETSHMDCNLAVWTLDLVNKMIENKSAAEIQALLNSYDKKNNNKCFYLVPSTKDDKDY